MPNLTMLDALIASLTESVEQLDQERSLPAFSTPVSSASLYTGVPHRLPAAAPLKEQVREQYDLSDISRCLFTEDGDMSFDAEVCTDDEHMDTESEAGSDARLDQSMELSS